MVRSVCSVLDCSNLVKSRRLCMKHYERAKYHGEFGELRCRACGANKGPLCERCVPTVCVCTDPVTDGIGECQQCHRVYKPHHKGLMDARRAWIAYLTKAGVLSNVAKKTPARSPQRDGKGVGVFFGTVEPDAPDLGVVDGPTLALSGPRSSRPG